MRVQYDRSATTINAWISLAAAVVCLTTCRQSTSERQSSAEPVFFGSL